jgi:signal transduction histidine kinase
MKPSPGRALTYALLSAAILAVGFNTWLAIRAVGVMARSEAWVARTWQVTHAAQTVITSMLSAESGDRGYLLTGDDHYLTAYNHARQVLPAEISQLQSLMPQNATQQERFAEMRALVETRIALLQQGIDLRRQGQETGLQAIVVTGTGQAEMDHLRALLDSIQTEENHLLAERTTRSRRARRKTILTISVASLLNLILILLAVWRFQRERLLRQSSELSASRLQRLQAVGEVGLSRLTVAELTQALMQRLHWIVDADIALLCRYNNCCIEVTATNGFDLRDAGPFPLSADSLLRVAAEQQQPVQLMENTIDQHPFAELHGRLQALQVLPLFISGNTGALFLVGRTSLAGRQPFDQELLSIIADRIALAMDRARAYEAEHDARRAAEQKAEEVRILNEELEERVRQRTAELEAANRELEAFSYSVSHDLRAPLRSVDGFSLALVEDYGSGLDDNARDYVQRIRKGVQRMGQLIDSLLQLSRITRADLSRETFDLSELAEEVLADLRAAHPERNIATTVQPGLMVEADPRLLRIALENLFGNAIKFSSRVLEAHIQFGRAASGEFYVRDNGAGFDMQYVSKLFNAFQRLHGDRDFLGSGIGLATVARVIRRHGGSIRAEGETGKGAVFSFTLG